MSSPQTTPDFVSPNVYGPIAPSQMFERTFRLLRDNFPLYAGIVLVLIGVEIVIGGILGGSGLWMSRFTASAAPMARVLVIFPIAFAGAVLLFILIQIVQGALFVATQSRLGNTPITVGEACKLAADKAGKLIGIAVLVALRTIGYLVLFYIGLAVVAMIAAVTFGFAHLAGSIAFRSGHMASAGLVIFLGVLAVAAVVLYCVVLLWLVVRYALSVPAALAENSSVTTSIRRSIHLSSGSRGRLYALFLGIACFYVAIVAVTIPMQVFFAVGHNMHPVAGGFAIGIVNIVFAVVRLLVSAVVVAWIGVATALCYFDLRVRKEGFGIAAAPPQVPSVATQPLLPDAGGDDLPATQPNDM